MSLKPDILCADEAPFIRSLRHLVNEVGGCWAGVQMALMPGEPSKIVFINPNTTHHLVVPFNPIILDSQTMLDLRTAIVAQLHADSDDFENHSVTIKGRH